MGVPSIVRGLGDVLQLGRPTFMLFKKVFDQPDVCVCPRLEIEADLEVTSEGQHTFMCGSGPKVGRTALAYLPCHFKRELILGPTVVRIDIDNDRS